MLGRGRKVRPGVHNCGGGAGAAEATEPASLGSGGLSGRQQPVASSQSWLPASRKTGSERVDQWAAANDCTRSVAVAKLLEHGLEAVQATGAKRARRKAD